MPRDFRPTGERIRSIADMAMARGYATNDPLWLAIGGLLSDFTKGLQSETGETDPPKADPRPEEVGYWKPDPTDPTDDDAILDEVRGIETHAREDWIEAGRPKGGSTACTAEILDFAIVYRERIEGMLGGGE